MATVLHLVGPGGAGKTTVGACLSRLLGWQVVDLDERFMSCEGDIAASIEAFGYSGYAKRNVAVYREMRRGLEAPAVVALSSGFLLYPQSADTQYPALCRSITADALTSLLLPAFELEACVAIIVRRQLSRPYLRGDEVGEERRIRERFHKFMALPCARFESDAPAEKIAADIARFVRDGVGVPLGYRGT